MSNTNNQRYGGLMLYRDVMDFPLIQCIALAGDSTPLGLGDPVTINSGGATNIGAGPTVMAVTRANGTSNPLYGVVEAILPILEGSGNANLSTNSRLASTAQYLLIRPGSHYDWYAIQDDGSASLTAANIGNNAEMTISNCDANSGQS